MYPDLRHESGLLGERNRVGERGELGGDQRVPRGYRRRRSATSRPTTCTEPRAWASRAASTSPGQSAGESAAPAQPGVGLEVQPAPNTPTRSAAAAAFAANAAEPAVTSTSCLIASAGSAKAMTAARGRIPACRSRPPRPGRRHPASWPRRPAPPGQPDHAVAVPVGLHPAITWLPPHHVAQGRDVPGNRAKVDESLPVHGAHRLRNAAGDGRTRSEAPIGAWPVRSGPSGAGASAGFAGQPTRPRQGGPCRAGKRPPGRPGRAPGPARAARRPARTARRRCPRWPATACRWGSPGPARPR